MEEHIDASRIVHTNKSKRQLLETKEDPELLGHKLIRNHTQVKCIHLTTGNMHTFNYNSTNQEYILHINYNQLVA